MGDVVTVEVGAPTAASYTGRVPSHCPVCGAYSLPVGVDVSVLLAVADALCLKVLDELGRWILAAPKGRDRHKALGQRPRYLAHTIWSIDDALVDKALRRGAWDVVEPLIEAYGGCLQEDVAAADVTAMLDDYIHDLAVAQRPHTREDLRYRFATRLGLEV